MVSVSWQSSKGGMTDPVDSKSETIEVVERFIAAFDRRWPTEDELADLVSPDVLFVERPNLINPAGSERNAAAMWAALDRGRQLLAWQAYEVRDHLARGDTVVTRMRWSGELAVEAGQWPAGTRMTAWCVAHYRLAAGRIVHIEQHDCYEQPSKPPMP
jgi:ketosteroid isomerase-like protein